MSVGPVIDEGRLFHLEIRQTALLQYLHCNRQHGNNQLISFTSDFYAMHLNSNLIFNRQRLYGETIIELYSVKFISKLEILNESLFIARVVCDCSR